MKVGQVFDYAPVGGDLAIVHGVVYEFEEAVFSDDDEWVAVNTDSTDYFSRFPNRKSDVVFTV